MIPKIIHWCWLSGDPLPEDIKECIKTWEEKLGGYEIRLWDTKRFDIYQSPWTTEAYHYRKYAFAADYIRLYALYNYGGIYLDSDVKVYKAFDDLLELPYFLGRDFLGCFEPAIVGVEKGTKWVKDVLDWYEGRHFVKETREFDIKNLPVVFFERLWGRYEFKAIESKEDFDRREGVISLFDSDFFNGRDNMGVIRAERSYTSHCFAASWSDGKAIRPGMMLLKALPRAWANKLLSVHYRKTQDKCRRYDPIYRQEAERDKAEGK